MPGFWQKLFGFLGSALGGSLATGDYPPAGPVGGRGNLQPRPQQPIATNTANITFDDHMNFAVTATNNNLYLAPGTDMTIQSGALGGDITLRTHYDANNMDRLIYFDNGAGTANNNVTTWTNGTTTASIQDLRIHEHEWRMQETARHAQHYLQGRINDHLNNQLGQQFNQRLDNTDQQLDAERYARQQRYAAQIMGQPQDYNGLAGQGQAQINIDNYDNVFRPFGGGLQGQRHEPPNLKTPRAIAEVRGNKLLKNIIGDVLHRHYEKNGYVDLPSLEKPGVGFRIRAHRRIGLLKQDRQGKWIEQKESLCIHAAGGYWVEGDQVGIHYMLCQCDEKKLWKQAIVHSVAA